MHIYSSVPKPAALPYMVKEEIGLAEENKSFNGIFSSANTSLLREGITNDPQAITFRNCIFVCTASRVGFA